MNIDKNDAMSQIFAISIQSCDEFLVMVDYAKYILSFHKLLNVQ